MSDIALYYPFTHVRDDAWLKAAALHWPKLAVMSRSGPARTPTETMYVLRDELDFFVDVDPAYQADRVAQEFITFITLHGAELRRRYAHLGELPAGLTSGPPSSHWQFNRFDVGGVGWINTGRLSDALHNVFVGQGLGIASETGEWVGMHPRLADVYITALAERLADANQMPAVTDQLTVYGALNGWDVDTLALVLLGDEDEKRPPRRGAADVAALYAAVAIRTVVPRGLDGIPVERVVQARRVLASEFDAFRARLDSLTDQFADMAQAESAEVLRARVQMLVERDLRGSVEELERGLRGVGLEPARAVLGMKSLELPAAAAAAATGFGIPAVAGKAGLVAAELVASGVRAGRAAQERRRSVAGYLLGLREELDPQGVVDRLRRTLRRAGRDRLGRRRFWQFGRR